MKNFHTVLFLFSSFLSWSQNDQSNSNSSSLFSDILGKTYVILIGVSEYQYLDASNQLNYADDDTELMKELFETWNNVHIKTFVNSEANRNTVGMAIHNTLNKQAVKGDRVIIYFSGHGDVDKTYGDGYLLLNEVTPPNDQIYQFSDALSMNELEAMMNKAANNGVDVLLITDACKSGSIEYARDANQRMLNIGNNTSSMVSCGPSELSYESVKYGGGHGVFTYYLAQGLMGLADGDDSKTITFKELSRYVEDNVSEAQAGRQNPMSKGLPNKFISNVNVELARRAQEQEDLMLNLATLETGKSFDPLPISYPTAYPLLKLLQERVREQFFSSDSTGSIDANRTIEDQIIKRIGSEAIRAITTNKDGSLFSTVTGNSLIVFGKDRSEVTTFKEHNRNVTCISFHPNLDNLVSCSMDNDAIYWNARTGETMLKATEFSSKVNTIRFLNTSLVALGADNGDLYLWNLNSTDSPEKVSIAKKAINDIDFDGSHLFIACENGKIYQFELESKKIIQAINAHPSTSSIAVAHTRGVIYSVGSDQLLKAWNISNLKEEYIIPLTHHDNREINGDNREIRLDLFENYCFLGSSRHNLDVIDLNTKTILKRLLNTRSGIVSLDFNLVTNDLYCGDSEGRLYINSFHGLVSRDLSALSIHKRLMDNPDYDKIQHEVDGTLIVGLNNYVSKILYPLVNGKANLPSLEEVQLARSYAKEAFELGKKYIVDNVRLEVNLLLLEVFQIIYQNKMDQFEDALTMIERISKIDPNGAYSYKISAALLNELNKFEEAKLKASKAEILAPVWAEASCQSGKILFTEGDYAAAEKKFLETIDKGPSLSKGYFNLGKLYTHIGRFNEGAENIEKAMNIDADVESYVACRIDNAFKTGDLITVKQLATEYSSRNFVQALISKADLMCMESETNYDEIYRFYKNAISIDPNNIEAINALAFFYLRVRDSDKADEFVKSYFSVNNSKSSNILKWEIKSLFDKAKRLDQNNINAEVGSWMIESVECNKNIIETMLSNNNNSGQAYAAVARYYLYREDVETALSYLKLGLDSDPYDYRCYVLSMEVNDITGNSKKNEVLKTNFTKQNPNSDALKYRKSIMNQLYLY